MTIRLIDRLGEIAPHYDGFILDLWGVLHDGLAPLPGALECLAALRDSGKRIVLLSNAPRRAADVVERIARIGVPSLYDHVMSSGEEAWLCLSRRDDPFYAKLGRRVLHIGSERDLGIREGLALDFVETVAAADFILNTGPAGWDDRLKDYAPVLDAARARSLPMVCANPDLVVMRGRTLHLCAGALAQHYEESGGTVRWHGKPYPSIYSACLALLGIEDRARILAIGDSLRTDIAGAAAAGLDSLFVTGGIHAEEFGVGIPDPERVAAAFAALPYRPAGVTGTLRW
ncbi:MAG: TIGR01459 family HAD-type hydrolase [Stellaceae bacterium]